nr:ADP-ribosylglycohydrolase family protein [Pseudomonas sp.]
MQRAAGCLAGLFIGDNLGAQVEFMDATQIARRCQQQPLRMEDGGVWDILAGQPTDDGELALALARSLVEKGGYCADSAAHAYVAWLESQPFDVGDTTWQALLGPLSYPQLSSADACHAASSVSSQANGALMRVAPIGIAAQGRPALAARWARLDACLTHPHPVCQEANAAFAAAIAVGVAGGNHQSMLAAALEQLSQDEAGAQVRQRLRAAAAGEPVAEFQQHMGWVLIALHNAFYQLLAGRSVSDAIMNTVLRGGDTDTNACIAGALVGAVEGVSSIEVELPLMVMSCRALGNTVMPRPAVYWPEDMTRLAMHLCK